ncbi:unnamed protein product [Lactuca saligna]|uniref:Uncharacterized protein n=1 Tax=Lactuca saligna TaxID=75948 RepID=A0AA35YTJ3_LACSI|nr:unnamed protein product [Lactuca saligna]
MPPNFSVKVGNVFHDLMGCQSRSLDEICSKFRDMRVKCLEFNKIYNFVINNVDEDDPFAVAMHRYEDTKHTPFKHVKGERSTHLSHKAGSQRRNGSLEVDNRKQCSPKGSPVVGEIDTRAPFQSVKAAVNLFGETSPKSGKPALRRSRSKNDEKVLEKETELHWTLKELDKYKELVKSSESIKAQARRDLEKARTTLHELTNKLEIIGEDKHAALEITEAAKYKAQQLELLKSSSTELSNDSWEEDLDMERQQYRASANELISTKQELTNLKQDFDAALEAKLAAFQQAADAQHAAKVNNEKMVGLTKEVDQMRETLHRVKLASQKAHEEHLNLIEEKDYRIESTKKAKEELDMKIESLRKEHQLSELRILGQKLEEKTEAINVLEEQLREVRVADKETLENAKLEVVEAKKRLEETKEEQVSVAAVVKTLEQELEKVRRDINLLRGDDLKREEQQAELDRIKNEIEEASFEITKATDGLKELELKIKEMVLEAERAKKEEESAKEQTEALNKQAENNKGSNKEAEESLEVALRELEKAKAAQELANEQIQKKTSEKDQAGNDNNNMIKISTEEYEALKRKTDEAEKAADEKIATAMAQVETIKKREKETLEKLEKCTEEANGIDEALADALKMAEMAEAAKEAIESELKKFKYKDQKDAN